MHKYLHIRVGLPQLYHYGRLRDASTDMPYFKWKLYSWAREITILQIISRHTELQVSVSWAGSLSYLGGEEGPAVGWGATAACAVAVVRHRPLQAQFGTARCRISFMIFCRRRQKQHWAWLMQTLYALWELSGLSRCNNCNIVISIDIGRLIATIISMHSSGHENTHKMANCVSFSATFWWWLYK